MEDEMKYVFACCTDRGTGRKNNQDSLLIKQAVYGKEQILLAMVCDGMGGLKRGEVASAALVRSFSEWFEQKLPSLLHTSLTEAKLFRSWGMLLQTMDRRIEAYGQRHDVALGTTVTAMLFARKAYYIMHVGDSRVYEVRRGIRQLTRDQTLVQQEVECGLLTRDEAERDARRNVLLQCVGASGEVSPMCRKGTLRKDTVYMLCCDGFRHMVSEKEMRKGLRPSRMKEERMMERQLAGLVRMNQDRGEQDDISVIAVRTYKERKGCWKQGQ